VIASIGLLKKMYDDVRC